MKYYPNLYRTLAESAGFEPAKRVNACLVSNEVVSATHPTLLYGIYHLKGATIPPCSVQVVYFYFDNFSRTSHVKDLCRFLVVKDYRSIALRQLHLFLKGQTIVGSKGVEPFNDSRGKIYQKPQLPHLVTAYPTLFQ